MSAPADGNSRDRWHPVLRGEELVPRHVAHGQLLGQELALWRDDAGHANAWENRCPHRGVRLSIGVNDGRELRCRYHGWRFASGSGQCMFIPAHPAQKPASSLRAAAYRVAEAHGYVWVGLGEVPESPTDARLAGRRITTLRSVWVAAPAAAVAQVVADAAPECGELVLVHWLQPVDAARTVIHAAVLDAPSGERLALLRRCHADLARLRDLAETRAGEFA